VNWLEQHLSRYEGTVIAVTHDRYFLDNVAGWILEARPRFRHAVQGNLLVLARAEAGDGSRGGTHGEQAPEGDGARARVDPAGRRARQSKGQARINAYEQMLKADVAEQKNFLKSLFTRARGLVTRCPRRRRGEGVWRQYCSSTNSNSALPPGESWESSANARAKPRCSSYHHLEKPNAGTSRLADGESAYVEQSRDSLEGNKTFWEGISDGQE